MNSLLYSLLTLTVASLARGQSCGCGDLAQCLTDKVAEAFQGKDKMYGIMQSCQSYCANEDATFGAVMSCLPVDKENDVECASCVMREAKMCTVPAKRSASHEGKGGKGKGKGKDEYVAKLVEQYGEEEVSKLKNIHKAFMCFGKCIKDNTEFDDAEMEGEKAMEAMFGECEATLGCTAAEPNPLDLRKAHAVCYGNVCQCMMNAVQFSAADELCNKMMSEDDMKRRRKRNTGGSAVVKIADIFSVDPLDSASSSEGTSEGSSESNQ